MATQLTTDHLRMIAGGLGRHAERPGDWLRMCADRIDGPENTPEPTGVRLDKTLNMMTEFGKVKSFSCPYCHRGTRLVYVIPTTRQYDLDLEDGTVFATEYDVDSEGKAFVHCLDCKAEFYPAGDWSPEFAS